MSQSHLDRKGVPRSSCRGRWAPEQSGKRSRAHFEQTSAVAWVLGISFLSQASPEDPLCAWMVGTGGRQPIRHRAQGPALRCIAVLLCFDVSPSACVSPDSRPCFSWSLQVTTCRQIPENQIYAHGNQGVWRPHAFRSLALGKGGGL